MRAAVQRTSADVWTTPYQSTVRRSSWYAGFALETRQVTVSVGNH